MSQRQGPPTELGSYVGLAMGETHSQTPGMHTGHLEKSCLYFIVFVVLT